MSVSRGGRLQEREGREGSWWDRGVSKEEPLNWVEGPEKNSTLGISGSCLGRAKVEAVKPLLVTLACPPRVASQGFSEGWKRVRLGSCLASWAALKASRFETAGRRDRRRSWLGGSSAVGWGCRGVWTQGLRVEWLVGALRGAPVSMGATEI